MYILGISAYYHDSAACLIKDEEIIAAAQEERFSRKKNDAKFPVEAIKFCLNQASISIADVSYIVFYDKPFLKFERLIETYLNEAPRGISSFLAAAPTFLSEKLFLKDTLVKAFKNLVKELQSNFDKSEIKKLSEKILFSEHHQSHAASAFYPSPFEKAAIVTIDGVGEWTTTSISVGEGNNIKLLKEIKFPHSLGLLYSAFTYYTGFKVNSGEYKVMGLAPYGEPKYVDLIKEKLIDLKDDGSFKLNMDYFNYTTGLTMTNDKFNKLFGAPPREPESDLTQKEMDIAASLQVVTEEVMLKLAKYAREVTGMENLCLAGGVALNCVGNGKILSANIFKDIWVQPAAGDAGGALGAAYLAYYQELGNSRTVDNDKLDKMQGAYLGPEFSDEKIKTYLDSVGAKYCVVGNEDALIDDISTALADGKIVGWHQGRMEFGPRALGNRSIIGDARNPKMQATMNLKIKYRESFRPFAPSVLRENVSDWFEMDYDSPYMLLVAPVKREKQIPMSDEQKKMFGLEKLNILRSEIPAVTHIDYSARVQTVHKETNPKYYELISKFAQKTGCPVIVNTSFNVRGEPIVCSPKDSYNCFLKTEMDILVINNFVLYK